MIVVTSKERSNALVHDRLRRTAFGAYLLDAKSDSILEGCGSTAILTSLAIIAAAAFVRLARSMPAIPSEITSVSSASRLSELFIRSVSHMRFLLLSVLCALVYMQIIPSIYDPLEKIGVDQRWAENLPSSIGFFLFFFVLAEAWGAVSLDREMANVQADLAQQAVASRGRDPEQTC